MNFISLLLFSISTNLDNIPIGISYSLSSKKKRKTDILKISFFTSLVTFMVMIIGKNISHIFPLNLSNTIGSLILMLIGGYGVIKEYITKNKENQNILNSNLSIYKIILLLCANNLATGFSASIAGLNCFLSSILIFIFSIFFLYIGAFIGNRIANSKVEEYSNYLSSAIILVLGLVEMIFT